MQKDREMGRRTARVVVQGALAAALLSASAGSVALGDEHIWTGGMSNAWNVDANWSSGVAPVASDALTFNDLSTAYLGTQMSASLSVGSLILRNPSGPVSVGGPFALTLNPGDGGTGIDMSAATQDLTISATTVALGSSQTWSVNTDRSLAISSVVAGSVALTKTGGGTLTLSGGSTFTGALNVQAGTLATATVNPSGADGPLGRGAVTLGGSGTTGTLKYTGASATGSRAFTMATGGAGAFQIDANNLTLSGVIGGSGGLTKTGAGTLTLSGTNTFSGVLSINGGTLATATINASGSNGPLGAATSAIVLGDATSKGTLSYTGNSSATCTRGFTLNAGGGEVDSAAGSYTLTIGTAGTITGSGLLTIGGTGSTAISSAIQTTGGLTVYGTGANSKLTLSSSANTYTGDTTVLAGTLRIGAANALPSGAGKGNVVVSSGATLDLLGNNITVNGLSGIGTVTGAATLTVGSNNETSDFGGSIGGGTALALTKIGSGTLTLSGGNGYSGITTISAGTLIVSSGTAIDDGGAVFLANTSGATLQLNKSETIGSLSGGGATGGNVNLQANTLTITAGSSTQSYDGVISGTGGLTKSGSGTQTTLTNANTYSGLTTVSAGVLNIQNNQALGDTTGGTSVTGVAALQIQNDITVGNEALALNGMGVSNDGALRSISGNNVWQGTVTLGGDSRINCDAGTLTLSAANSVTGTIQNLTLGGAGGGTVSGTITTGSGALTKDGIGTWTLAGANTHAGETTVNAGVLNIRHATALGTAAGGTTVAINAALQIQNDITVGNEALTLKGMGVSNDGALRNVSGNNVWQGALTLGGSARINSDVGTLTLSAANGITMDTIGRNLTLGGAGSGTVSGMITIGSGSLTKDGAGTWTLCGANTWTGATAVSAGTLALNGGSLAGTPVAVGTASANATLQVSGNYTIGNGAAGSLTLAGGNGITTGGTLSMVDGSVNTLTLSSTSTAAVLTIGGTTASARSVLNLEVGSAADRITVTTGKVLIQAGLANINITGLGGLSGTTQTLISGTGATGTGTRTYADLANGATLTTSGDFGGRTVSLGSTSTSLTLNESGPAAAPAAAYWKGTNDGNWNSFTGGNSNITNWATDAAGTNATQVPDGNSNVYFSVTGGGANPGTALGQDFAINSLSFTAAADTSHQVTIGGGNTLTINATIANGNTGGNGITVATGSGNQTISINVALGNSQTWTVTDAVNTLTVSNEISGAGKELTKAGAGTLILSNANIYTGATTVTGGTLLVNGSTATSSAVTVADATLGGTGNVQGTVTINSGGKIAPGTSASPFGTLTTGAQIWNAGGQYLVDVGAATGTAGKDWDLLSMSGLTLGSFGVNVTATNLTLTKQTYDWLIAQSSIGSFDTSMLQLTTSGFGQAATKFSLVALDTDNNGTKDSLYLHYSFSSVPEATTLLLGAVGFVPILMQRRARRSPAV